MSDLEWPALVAILLAAAVATWISGIALSRATEALDQRLQLGAAFGGLILLAIGGTLPEVAITVVAVLQGNLDLAAGNLIGGIAVQTVVLAICDRAVSGDKPLSYLVGSLIPVIEGALVVLVVAIMLMGTMLPGSVELIRLSPASVGILVTWLAGVVVIARLRGAEPWQVTMPGSRPGRRHRRTLRVAAPRPLHGARTPRVVLIFGVGAAVTLIAGAILATSGGILANRLGINGVVFGATALAGITALPEISSGIEAVRLGDHQLAVGDIFGGNAFQLSLFVVADLLAGKPVLPAAGPANAWLGALGIVLTVIYMGAIIIRPRRRFAGFGADSILVSAIFALGIWGLTILAG